MTGRRRSAFWRSRGQDDPLFVVNSFSKSWAMTGWRIGWLIFPQGCIGAFEKLIQFNTSGGLEFMQAAGHRGH